MSKARILLVEDSEAQAGIDTFGHKAGDLVLIEIANIIKENVRDVDTVGDGVERNLLQLCLSQTKTRD